MDGYPNPVQDGWKSPDGGGGVLAQGEKMTKLVKHMAGGGLRWQMASVHLYLRAEGNFVSRARAREIGDLPRFGPLP
jgi:hypothetical protein